MVLLRNRRVQAGVGTGLLVTAGLAPTVLQRLNGNTLGLREIVGVECAGTGGRMVELTEGDLDRLEQYRLVLGVRDNFYVAGYITPIILGVDLLPDRLRKLGVCLATVTATADVIENLALEQALMLLIEDPERPQRADQAALRARNAAIIKFAALGPALGMAIWGIAAGRN